MDKIGFYQAHNYIVTHAKYPVYTDRGWEGAVISGNEASKSYLFK